MDIKHIKTQLARLATVTENWNENEDVPAIERQIVLDALASLYEEIRFGRMQLRPQQIENTPVPESVSENEHESAMATPIDLSNIFPAEEQTQVPEMPEPDDNAEPAAETEPSQSPALEPEGSENAAKGAATETVAAGLLTEEVSEPDDNHSEEYVPVATSTDRDAPKAAATPVESPETVSGEDTEPQPATGLSTDAQALTDTTSASIPDTVPDDMQTPESTDTATPTAPADNSADVPQPQHSSGQSALFDLDKIKRSRNNSRRIIMSLYGESGTTIQSSADRPTVTTEPNDDQKSPTTADNDQHTDSRTAEPQDHKIVSQRMTDNIASQQENYPPAPVAATSVNTHIPEPKHEPYRTERPSALASEGKPRPVLGEVINAGSKTVGEAMAETPKHDITEKIVHNDRITDLNQAIGINDKFIMIRDLFNGDGARYDAAIAELNRFDNFDACLIHIASHYRWDPDSDGAKLLMEILSRKLL